VDIGTLIGFAGVFAIVLYTMISNGGISMYYDTHATLLVLVGAALVSCVKFGLPIVLNSVKAASKAFIFKIDHPEDLIEEIVGLADTARKGGLLALEGKEVGNEFLQKGIQLLVDGHDPTVVKGLLTKDMKLAAERHEWGAKMFKELGALMPGLGMVGTLFGLVAMLGNMNDPKAIGPAMSVALTATLYGAVFANMVMLPIADKLTLRRHEELELKMLIIDALIAIQSGLNPRVIDTMLRNYLPEGKRAAKE